MHQLNQVTFIAERNKIPGLLGDAWYHTDATIDVITTVIPHDRKLRNPDKSLSGDGMMPLLLFGFGSPFQLPNFKCQHSQYHTGASTCFIQFLVSRIEG
jgi:hypothetical protein